MQSENDRPASSVQEEAGGKGKKRNAIAYVTTLRERVSFGSYGVGLSVFNTLISSFLVYFLTDYRFLSPAIVGAVFLVAKIWDGVNDPLFGIIVDRANLKSGKFVPWLRVGIFVLPIAAIITFVMPLDMSSTAKITYAVLSYMLFDVGYTICDVPMNSLLTAVTDNIVERSSIVTLRQFCNTVAALLISMLVMPLVRSVGWGVGILIFAAVGLATMFPLGRTAKERFIAEQKKGEKYSVREIFSYILSNRYMLLFYGAMILTGVTNTSLSISNYVAKNLLGGENLIGIYSVIRLVPVLLSAPLVQFIIKRVDKFLFYIISNVTFIGINIALYLIGYRNVVLVFILTALLGFAMGCMGIVMGMFAADCVEYGHFKSGTRAVAITMSLQTLAGKFVRAIGGAVAGFALSYFQYDATLPVQTDFTKNGIWMSATLIPCVGYILSVSLQMFYKLRDRDVQIMAKANKGEIGHDEALAMISKKIRF